jgi:site-specific DNA-methyltransferase (adenine-specific)
MCEIQIYNENCLSTLSRIEDNSINLFLQDTPFGVTQNDWDIVPYLVALWPEWIRTAKENAAFIFFATQPFASDLINSNRKMFKYDLIWYKALGTGFLNAKKMPLRNHEHLLVFYKKLPTYNPQKGVGVRKKGRATNKRTNTNYGEFGTDKEWHYFDDKGTRYPQSVLDFTNGDRTTEQDHPTQKPIDLIRHLIKMYSNENDLVFDGYLGSGTTAAACLVENRRFIGSELKAEYFSIVERRIKKIKNTPTLFNGDSKVA